METGQLTSASFVTPDWPAPNNVRAYATTRIGGASTGVYEGLNVGTHVGDIQSVVLQNRAKLPNAPNMFWLKQTHSALCLDLPQCSQQQNDELEGDASFTEQTGQVCAVMTADCLPLLVCNKQGTQVAAIHAGWKGLANGVIENCLTMFNAKPEDLLVWFGPAISRTHFEVGPDVKEQFSQYPQSFTLNANSEDQKYFMDIYQIAREKLLVLGINNVFGGTYCTYADKELFFSHRRATHELKSDSSLAHSTRVAQTGRMVSAIYIT